MYERDYLSVQRCQVGQAEYDPADILGQWLDSAKDVFVPRRYNVRLERSVPMLPKSTRYTGQMYVGDEEICGATQRFILPSRCTQAYYMALGLPFCMSSTNI